MEENVCRQEEEAETQEPLCPSFRGLRLQLVSLCPQPSHQDPTREKLYYAVQAESQHGHASGLDTHPQ